MKDTSPDYPFTDDPGDEQGDLLRDDEFYGTSIVVDTTLDGGWDR